MAVEKCSDVPTSSSCGLHAWKPFLMLMYIGKKAVRTITMTLAVSPMPNRHLLARFSELVPQAQQTCCAVRMLAVAVEAAPDPGRAFSERQNPT